MTWVLYSDGTLKITGSGEMWSWESGKAPWYSQKGKIKSISIEGATTIGSYAFYQCINAKEIVVGDGVTVLEKSAFSRCDGLKRIVLPDSLESVSRMAFYGLVLLDVDGTTALGIDSESLRGAIYEGIGDKTLVRLSEVAVDDEFTVDRLKYKVTSKDPATASVIGYEGRLKALVVPEDVVYNGITLDVTAIGPSAFYGCRTMASANLGSVTKVDTKAFARCTYLNTVDAGDSLSTVSAYAFFKCTRLVDFNTDDSLKTLKVFGSHSFENDTKLNGISVPSFMKTVSANAFSQTFVDENGNDLETNAESLIGYTYVNVDGAFVRQPGPEMGKEYTLDGLKYTVTASMPAEVGISGYTVKPTSVTVSGPLTIDGVAYDVTSVMEKAFYRCTTITSADLPGIERVGTNAFYGCTKMTSVNIPDASTIGVKAFARCSSLSDLETGQSLKTVAAYAFFNCSSLESFDGGDNLRTVGSLTFNGCSSLKEVDLGSSLRIVGEKAFVGCPLESIGFSSVLKSVKPLAFDGLVFQDADGNVISQTAKSLRGHNYLGTGGVLVESF